MSGVVGVEDANGGDGDGFSGVEVDELGLALLRFLELGAHAVVDLFFARCEGGRVDGFAEVGEDVVVERRGRRCHGLLLPRRREANNVYLMQVSLQSFEAQANGNHWVVAAVTAKPTAATSIIRNTFIF